MKVAGVMFAFVILAVVIMMFSPMNESITDIRVDTREDILSAPTGIGETTADVVLVAPLWQATIISVETITSSVGTDIPAADSYDNSTRTLTVRDLTANTDPRSLTINYKYAALADSGSEGTTDKFLEYLPLIIGIGIFIIVIGIALSFWRR